MSDRICFPYEDEFCGIPEFVRDMKEIYERMADGLSREILASRILLCLTEDYSCMRNVILKTAGGQSLRKVMESGGEKPQYIYGAGIRGKRMAGIFPDHNWGGFIDRNKERDTGGLRLWGIEEFLKVYTRGTVIFVSNMEGTEEIKMSLRERGIAPEDIYVLNDFAKEGSEHMYFQKECIGTSLDRDKAFVDIGCYDGTDSLNYMRWNNDNSAKIYAFEPDIRNYRVCEECLKGYPNVRLFHMGLSDTEDEIRVAGEGETSHLDEKGSLKIRTQRLDEVIRGDSVGYIKMDVEGFEERVLRGAEEIIRNQKPMLAVSLYHKRFDVWRIPMLLLEYNGNYRFYLRYYGATNGDTVLYAVDESRGAGD